MLQPWVRGERAESRDQRRITEDRPWARSVETAPGRMPAASLRDGECLPRVVEHEIRDSALTRRPCSWRCFKRAVPETRRSQHIHYSRSKIVDRSFIRSS